MLVGASHDTQYNLFHVQWPDFCDKTVSLLLTFTPTTVPVIFLEPCKFLHYVINSTPWSLTLQDTKSESSQHTTKLNLMILLCITEDQYANALMHDPNLVFRVKLHRAPMRHRKPSVDTNSYSRSLGMRLCSKAHSHVRLVAQKPDFAS